MKTQRNYQSLLVSSTDSSGIGDSGIEGGMRSQSDDEMLDITTGTTDDLRRVPNRSHGNSHLLRNGAGNLTESDKIEAGEDDLGEID